MSNRGWDGDVDAYCTFLRLTPIPFNEALLARCARVSRPRTKLDRAVRGSPDPAQNWTEGLPGQRVAVFRGDLRSAVPAGSGDPRRALVLPGDKV